MDAYNRLIDLYKERVGPDQQVIAGGLQHLLNHHEPYSTEVLSFDSLPIDVKLLILSYLSALDLGMICRVSKHWNDLACDTVLWHKKLLRDMSTWENICCTGHPDVFIDQTDSVAWKDVYLRCSGLVKVNPASPYGSLSIKSLKLSVFKKVAKAKNSRIAMFGPGLELTTKVIIRKILNDESGVFKQHGAFPGMSGGVGSGYSVQLANNCTLDLIVLYSNTQAVRDAESYDRLQQGKMMQQAPSSSSQMAFKMSTQMRELCKSIDGFVCVLDSSQSSVVSALPELEAMVERTKSPLCVMSCRLQQDTTHLSSLSVARQLQLRDLMIHWQVMSCVVEDKKSISNCLEWIAEKINN